MKINEEVRVRMIDVSLNKDEMEEAIREYIENNWEGTDEGLEIIRDRPLKYVLDGRSICGCFLRFDE